MTTATENGVVVLTAGEGMRLTDGVSFVTTVRLGKEDSAGRWHEITEEEAAEFMNEGADAFAEDYEEALRELGVEL